jgi:hypothetical protein
MKKAKIAQEKDAALSPSWLISLSSSAWAHLRPNASKIKGGTDEANSCFISFVEFLIRVLLMVLVMMD